MSKTYKARPVAHGVDPQRLFPEIVKRKVWEDRFWKEQLFGLTAETIIDVAIKCKYIGGTHGGARHPTPFISLLLKLCQLAPEMEVIIEYIKQDEFKYLRALAAMYIRIAAKSTDVFNLLEPVLSDYRKLRVRNLDGTFSITTMDVFIDNLLNLSHLFDVDFPHLPRRETLENSSKIELRPWLLEDLSPEQVENDYFPRLEADFDKNGCPRNLVSTFESEHNVLCESKEEDGPKDKIQRDGDNRTSLEVSEWNAIRLKLGLKPLS
eukprot:GDKJ01022491.1.p1 GENE.GDKJ01022491.1~~GDKJ01022491.1.p1  ORF type:complete len:265 (-),score=28.30 GDKJ01022491.1:61-855(-)